MVDVSDKPATERLAVAEGRVVMTKATLDLIVSGNAKKGDVPLALTDRVVAVRPDRAAGVLRIRAEAATTGPTGVEMEALMAASVAALTIYDMVKGVERGVEIRGVRLVSKTGGKSGEWHRPVDERAARAPDLRRPGDRVAGRVVARRRGPTA